MKDLMPLQDYLADARARHYALGGFCLWTYAYGMAIAEVAQKLNLPMLYIIGDAEVKFFGGEKNAVAAARTIAENVDVPVILHADHFREFESIQRAIDAGFRSVMIDASSYPFEENVERTVRVVEYAHKAGVSVEGELGRIAGCEQKLSVNEAEAMQTDPDEAAEFAERTGVDCLAVSIGTQHGAYVAAPHLNIERLKKIHEVVKVPLVLHGGSGTPVEQVQDSIRNGIRKINVATDVLTTMIKTYTNLSTQEGFKYNTAIYPKVKDAMKEFIKGKMLDFSFRR